MIGFAVATAVEVLLPGPDTGLFGAWAQSDIAGQFAALGMVLLCCSGMVACDSSAAARPAWSCCSSLASCILPASHSRHKVVDSCLH